jgi:hypothetical protein
MPRSPAEELRIEARRLKVAELYLHGMRCLTDIARELKVDKATISRDFKHIRKLWRETYIEDLDVAKRDELASIAEIERKAWLGWERSCKDAETMEVTGTSQGGKSKPDKVKKITKGQAGDSRFLAITLGCVKQRCELYAFKAECELPVKVRISWDDLFNQKPKTIDPIEEIIRQVGLPNGQGNGEDHDVGG